MRRMVAPVFVLLVLTFVAYGALSILIFVPRLGTWHMWVFAGWLGLCAALVVGGNLVERRRRRRKARQRAGSGLQR